MSSSQRRDYATRRPSLEEATLAHLLTCRSIEVRSMSGGRAMSAGVAAAAIRRCPDGLGIAVGPACYEYWAAFQAGLLGGGGVTIYRRWHRLRSYVSSHCGASRWRFSSDFVFRRRLGGNRSELPASYACDPLREPTITPGQTGSSLRTTLMEAGPGGRSRRLSRLVERMAGHRQPEAWATLIYTSGTTECAKGVMVPTACNLIGSAYGVKARDQPSGHPRMSLSFVYAAPGCHIADGGMSRIIWSLISQGSW